MANFNQIWLKAPYDTSNIKCRNKRPVCIQSDKNLETVILKRGRGAFSSQQLLSQFQRNKSSLWEGKYQLQYLGGLILFQNAIYENNNEGDLSVYNFGFVIPYLETRLFV